MMNITERGHDLESDQPIILDLGCGQTKKKDAIGVDIVPGDGVDIVLDLQNFPYPWESDSIDEVFCSQVLEHFDCETGINMLREIHRILKPEGVLTVRVPHVYSLGSFQDPTHRTFFTLHTIDYLVDGKTKVKYRNIDCFFNLIKRDIGINCFYDWTRLGRGKRAFNAFCTALMKKLLDISPELCDITIRLIPFWYVEIGWVLQKETQP